MKKDDVPWGIECWFNGRIVQIEASVVAKSEFVSEFATQSHLSNKAWFWSWRSIIPRPPKRFGRVTFFHGSRQLPPILLLFFLDTCTAQLYVPPWML
jgi:hypothetical protein